MDQSSGSSTPQHGIRIAGAVNFRDIGGHPTLDNRQVQPGRVYRSDHLSRLTAEDQQILLGHGFKVVCDFRSPREAERAPDLLPDHGSIRYLFLPVEDAYFDPARALERLKAGDRSFLSMDFVIGLYRRYLDNFGPIWGAVLSLAASPQNLPLLFHCTGGKDRTGICAALLLLALGVDEACILSEHERSAACNAERVQPLFDKLADLGIDPEQAIPYLGAPVEPLAALLEHLRATYGTVEEYLLQKGRMERAVLVKLRKELLR